MGHNRAADNRKKRLRRIKRENTKLNAWSKRVHADWSVRRDHIWAFLGQCLGGPRLLYSPNEPPEINKVRINLPEPMEFREAISYLSENSNELYDYINAELKKLNEKK